MSLTATRRVFGPCRSLRSVIAHAPRQPGLLLVGSVLIALSGTELHVSPNAGSQPKQQTSQTAQIRDLSPDSPRPDQTAAEEPVPEPAHEAVDAAHA